MIFKNVIHVQIEGGEDGNVESIGTLKVNDCLCAVHDA